MRYLDSVGESREIIVPPEARGSRLDVFLAQTLAEPSRTFLQRLIEDHLVAIEPGKAKASYRLKGGERVVVFLPEPVELSAEPEPIPLTILYEDEHLLLIHKQAGLVIHPSPGHEKGTLVNALLYHCKNLSGIGGVLRPGIVHRLDRDTSGCLVVAKSDAVHRDLTEQFAARRVEKVYLALTDGVPSPPEGIIEGGIGRDPHHRQKMRFFPLGGRPSLTRYRVLEEWGRIALVECRIETGRTHQIRVHMKHLRTPVLCDGEYGRGGVITAQDLENNAPAGPPLLARQALHAWRLSFHHPIEDRWMSFEAPLPEDMAAVLRLLREKKTSYSSPGPIRI